MKNYIDFKSKPSSSQYGPVCNDLELPTNLIIDTLPGLSNRGRLDYSAETGLKMVRYAMLTLGVLNKLFMGVETGYPCLRHNFSTKFSPIWSPFCLFTCW